MDREELRNTARQMVVAHAPDLAVHAAEAILNSPRMQRWFASVARKRPNGIVALIRRLRGEQRGLTLEQENELRDLVRQQVEKQR